MKIKMNDEDCDLAVIEEKLPAETILRMSAIQNLTCYQIDLIWEPKE